MGILEVRSEPGLKKPWRDGPLVKGSLFEWISRLRPEIAATSTRWPESVQKTDLIDIEKACERIWRAINANEIIAIVGDYDLDGTAATVVVWEFFTRCGVTPIVKLPTRAEGYGFSPDMVTELHDLGVTLIITVDCGITANTAVDAANTLGIDVVITDHHQCPPRLPAALAVINPSRLDSSYREPLSGTGVAFKLVLALSQTTSTEYRSRATIELAAWSLDIVALATLADMVPLIGENRALVELGSKIIGRGRRRGLRRLILSLDLDLSMLSYRDWSYKIIPLLNSAGRIDHMEEVFTLLTASDDQIIDRAVAAIRAKQTQARIRLDSMVAEAQAQIESAPDVPLLLVKHETWHTGLTGLLAGRLASQVNKPTLVLAKTDGNLWRGSGRSAGGLDIHTFLQSLSELCIAFGGHPAAVGLTISDEMVSQFIDGLVDSRVIPITPEVFGSDGQLIPGQLAIEDVNQLASLAPWGVGNPEPTWSISQATVESVQSLSNGLHTKLRFQEFPNLDILLFNSKKYSPITKGEPMDVCGTLSINEFRGVSTPQMVVRDLYYGI